MVAEHCTREKALAGAASWVCLRSPVKGFGAGAIPGQLSCNFTIEPA